MFRVEVKGLESVFQKLRGLQVLFRSDQVWSEIGHLLRARILVRTARGVDADSKPFADYSAGYKLYRKKHGHAVSKVNLFWSGVMLPSMDVAPLPEGGVRLFFQPTQAPNYPTGKRAKKPRVSPKSPAKAYYLQNHPTKPRKFFAASKQDMQEAAKLLLDHLKRNLEA